MEYTKSKEDEEAIKHDLNTNQVLVWLKNADKFKFNVGDILIKENLRYIWSNHAKDTQQIWEIEISNSITKEPKKFVYAFENEFGIGYLKQIKADGTGFTKGVKSVLDLNPKTCRLKLHPDYEDSIILGEKIDVFEKNKIHSELKAKRKKALQRNAKICRAFSSIEEVNSYFDTLKVGQKLWVSYSLYDIFHREYTVKKISRFTAKVNNIGTIWLIKPGETMIQVELAPASNDIGPMVLRNHDMRSFYVCDVQPDEVEENKNKKI